MESARERVHFFCVYLWQMEVDCLSFESSHGISKLMQRYLDKDQALQPFISFSPSIEGISKAIDQRSSYDTNRTLLVNCLKRQHKGFDLPAAVQNNIEALLQNETYTITTGHQLSLVSGPAFFFYKILNVIQLTRTLKQQYKEYNFVPVFWMASEDHDFEEISKATLFQQNFHWDKSYEGPVGRIKALEAKPVIDQIITTFGSQESDDFCKEVLTKAYDLPTLADAIRYIVISFLGEHGVVVIDGDDRELKKSFSNIFWEELKSQTLANAWKEQTEKLEQESGASQLHIRDINVFYIENNYRSRIKEVEGEYQTIDGQLKWTEKELQSVLEQHPEKFSPNASLRPVYQEYVLPNLAYIGGPGEMSYWLQLKSGFDAVNVFFPVLFLRNSVYFLDKGDLKKMEKYELTFTDFFDDIHQLESSLANKFSQHEASLAEEIDRVQKVFKDIKGKASAIDGSLEGKVGGMEANVTNMIEGLEKRLVKAQKQNNEVMLNQVHSVRDKILPNGVPQERIESFLSFYVKNEGKKIVSFLIEKMSVLEQEVLVIY